MEYTSITLYDQLALARDALRGAESDHYRRSNEPETATTEQVEQLADRIKFWRAEIKRLEAEIEADEARRLEEANAATPDPAEANDGS